jgi:hypothetical protein
MEEKSCMFSEVSHMLVLGTTVYRLHNLMSTLTKPIIYLYLKILFSSDIAKDDENAELFFVVFISL